MSWIDRLQTVRTMVIGDVALDRFVYGEARRISPEAPIPVVKTRSMLTSLGCAGNVAANLAALECEVTLIGVVGQDPEAQELLRAVHSHGPRLSLASVVDGGRPTTVKTRIVAAGQQVVRIDQEDSAPLDADTEQRVVNTFRAALLDCDVVVISDYAKGVLTDRVLRDVIVLARAAGKIVLVDPKRPRLDAYRGATIIKPNRSELALAVGHACDTDADIERAATDVAQRTGATILVTRSESGMSLIRADREPVHERTRAQEVYDVSGAGDTVCAVMAAALGGGLTAVEAMRLANVAAGLVVAKRGTATVSLTELRAALSVVNHGYDSGAVDIQVALELREQWRREGLRCGFTNGCFDLVHPGHVTLLQQSKRHCDRLIVAINSDDSVRRLKGPARPLQLEEARAKVISSIKSVDLVVIFDDDTPLQLIERLKPDVLIKGSDYTKEQVVGADLITNWGGRLVLADLVPEQSTTRLVQRGARGAGLSVVG